MSDNYEDPAPAVHHHPKPEPAPKPTQHAEAASGSAFPILLTILFAASIVASWFFQGTTPPAAAATPAPAPTTAAPAAGDAPPAATPVAPVPATSDDIKAVKSEVEALAKKLEGMPKPDLEAGLKPIQEKIDALAKSSEASVEATKKVDELAAKFAESDKALASLKEEVAAVKGELKAKPAGTPAAAPASAPSTEPAKPAASGEMTAAVDLFKGGKYAEALDAFKKLQAVAPEDARVYYYTALANGISTKNWKGETETTVLKGVEREKAGTPAKAEIDAAFSGLTAQQGKDWLTFYRSQAK